MPSLSDTAVQNQYVASCAQLWKDWRTFGVGPFANNTRRLKFQAALNQALKQCNIPNVAFEDGPSPFLITAQWKIKFGGGYLNAELDVDTWARGATTLYHEARHAEQWYLIAMGIAAGKLLLPQNGPPANALPVTADAIGRQCGIPALTAASAFQHRNEYPMQRDAQIRGWYRSIYGAYRLHRGEVLQHLSWDNYMNPAPDDNLARYFQLPEEKDAFMTQDEVLARLSNSIGMWGRVPA